MVLGLCSEVYEKYSAEILKGAFAEETKVAFTKTGFPNLTVAKLMGTTRDNKIATFVFKGTGQFVFPKELRNEQGSTHFHLEATWLNGNRSSSNKEAYCFNLVLDNVGTLVIDYNLMTVRFPRGQMAFVPAVPNPSNVTKGQEIARVAGFDKYLKAFKAQKQGSVTFFETNILSQCRSKAEENAIKLGLENFGLKMDDWNFDLELKENLIQKALGLFSEFSTEEFLELLEKLETFKTQQQELIQELEAEYQSKLAQVEVSSDQEVEELQLVLKELSGDFYTAVLNKILEYIKSELLMGKTFLNDDLFKLLTIKAPPPFDQRFRELETLDIKQQAKEFSFEQLEELNSRLGSKKNEFDRGLEAFLKMLEKDQKKEFESLNTQRGNDRAIEQLKEKHQAELKKQKRRLELDFSKQRASFIFKVLTDRTNRYLKEGWKEEFSFSRESKV